MIDSCLFGSTDEYNSDSTWQQALVTLAVHDPPSIVVAVAFGKCGVLDGKQNGSIPPMSDAHPTHSPRLATDDDDDDDVDDEDAISI